MPLAHADDHLKFFADHEALADAQAFAAYLAPLRKVEWVVYAKRPFGGPAAVLAYLSRYSHRVLMMIMRPPPQHGQRLIKSRHFQVEGYRSKGPDRYEAMTLDINADLPSLRHVGFSPDHVDCSVVRSVVTCQSPT